MGHSGSHAETLPSKGPQMKSSVHFQEQTLGNLSNSFSLIETGKQTETVLGGGSKTDSQLRQVDSCSVIMLKMKIKVKTHF